MKNLYEGLNMAQRKKLDRELKIRAQPKMRVPMAPGRPYRAEMQRLALAKALRIGATI
jgi:hypothetical protein